MNNISHAAPTFDIAGINLAQYRKETYELYAGNAYIEALPELPDEKGLVQRLACRPKFAPQEREMSVAHRLMALSKIKHIFVPTQRVVEPGPRMQLMMFEGYAPRSPGTRSDRENGQRLATIMRAGSFPSSASAT